MRSVDLQAPKYGIKPDQFIQGDLRQWSVAFESIDLPSLEFFSQIYQLAADMGGAGYIFSGTNDASVMHNSAQINLNVLEALAQHSSYGNSGRTLIFYSSSACIYPEEKQSNSLNPGLKESDAYPANPDSAYGWEKLFSENLYDAYRRNHGLQVRIARFHNIFGPQGTWFGGREKAPAAICRKVLEASNPGEVEIWGDGKQTRSFLYIDECIDAVLRLMESSHSSPINIGSEELVSIDDLVYLASSFESKQISIRHVDGPTGVRGRNSNNSLVRSVLDWNYSMKLEEGLRRTYFWIKNQIDSSDFVGLENR